MLWRRNASLAGGFAGRPVLVMCFVVSYDLPFAGISQVSCLPLFHCLCRYQDRATEHLRPNPRKKKKRVCTHSILLSENVKISDISEMNPLVFYALEEVNLFFTLMVRLSVMVDNVFARFMFYTFYWR